MNTTKLPNFETEAEFIFDHYGHQIIDAIEHALRRRLNSSHFELDELAREMTFAAIRTMAAEQAEDWTTDWAETN